MVQRYCTNCGAEVGAGDRFCAVCGTAVRDAATSPPPTAPTVVPYVATRSRVVGPAVATIGVFFVLGLASMILAAASVGAERPFGYALGFGIGNALADVVSLAVLLLVVGGVRYLLVRKNGTTFVGVIFNWPMVALAAVITLLLLVI